MLMIYEQARDATHPSATTMSQPPPPPPQQQQQQQQQQHQPMTSVVTQAPAFYVQSRGGKGNEIWQKEKQKKKALLGRSHKTGS